MNRTRRTNRQDRAAAPQSLRIIGGVFRSRRIAFPAAEGLRPTGDRIRETVFNWLGQTLAGKACLDLYAGSGAMGFEALSRGASPVTFVDANPAVVRQLRATAETLGVESLSGAVANIRHADALAHLAHDRHQYDVIFLDPPFALDPWTTLLSRLPDKLSAEGRVYVEAPEPPQALSPPPPGWHIIRESRAGAVWFALLQHDS